MGNRWPDRRGNPVVVILQHGPGIQQGREPVWRASWEAGWRKVTEAYSVAFAGVGLGTERSTTVPKAHYFPCQMSQAALRLAGRAFRSRFTCARRLLACGHEQVSMGLYTRS
jgi:hypothetical protein